MTLSEIEAATEALTLEQKEELFLFLAARLKTANGNQPAPREFSKEQIQSWITDDETGMKRLREDR